MAEINKQMEDIGIPPIVPFEDETEKEMQVRAEKEFFTEQPYKDTDVKPLSLTEKWSKAQKEKQRLKKEGITGRKRIKELWEAPIDSLLDVTQVSKYEPPTSDAPMWKKVLHYGTEVGVGVPVKTFLSIPAGGIGFAGGFVERTLSSTQIYFPEQYKNIFGDTNPSDIAHEFEESLGIGLLAVGTTPKTIPLSKTQRSTIKRSKQYKKAETEIIKIEKEHPITLAPGTSKLYIKKEGIIDPFKKKTKLEAIKEGEKGYTTPPKKGAGTYLGKNIEPVIEKLNKKERPLTLKEQKKQPDLLESPLKKEVHELIDKQYKTDVIKYTVQLEGVDLTKPFDVLRQEWTKADYLDLPRAKQRPQQPRKGAPSEIKMQVKEGQLSGTKDPRRVITSKQYEHTLNWLYDHSKTYGSEQWTFLNRLKNLPEEPVVGNNFAIGYKSKGYEFRQINLPIVKNISNIGFNLDILKPHQLAEIPGKPVRLDLLISYLESLAKNPEGSREAGRRIPIKGGFEWENPVTTLGKKHAEIDFIAKAEKEGHIVNIQHKVKGKWVDGGIWFTPKGEKHINKPLSSRIKTTPKLLQTTRKITYPADVGKMIGKLALELDAEGFTRYKLATTKAIPKVGIENLINNAKALHNQNPFESNLQVALLEIQYDSGLRGGELLKLRRSDIIVEKKPKQVSPLEKKDVPTGRLKIKVRKEVAKSRVARDIIIGKEGKSSSSVQAYVDYLAHLEAKYPQLKGKDHYIFPNIKGNMSTHMETRHYNTRLKNLQKKGPHPVELKPETETGYFSFDIKSHDIRRARATHMIDEGISRELVREKMGHTSLAMTELYTSYSVENLTSILRKYASQEEFAIAPELLPLEEFIYGKQKKAELPSPKIYLKALKQALKERYTDLTNEQVNLIIKKHKKDLTKGKITASELLLPRKRQEILQTPEYAGWVDKSKQSYVLKNLQEKAGEIKVGDNRPMFETTDPLRPTIKYKLPVGTKWVDPYSKIIFEIKTNKKTGQPQIEQTYTKSQLQEFKKSQKKFKSFE